MNKVVTIFILLMLSKISDLLTTFYVDRDLTNETSILVRVLNFGWMGFICVNALLISLIVLLLKYINKKEESISKLEKECVFENFVDYMFYILYDNNEKKQNVIYHLFFGKMRYKVFIYFFLYSLIYTIILMNFIVSINNILIYYDVYDLMNYNDETLRFLLFAFNVLFILCFFIKILHMRYENARNNTN